MEEFDIKQIMKIFWRHKLIIVLFTVLGIIAGYIYNVYLTTPKYKATATFLLSSSTAGENVNEQVAITQQDITLNSKIINNYTELIKSDVILDEVIKNYQILTGKSDIKKGISVKVKQDTEFAELSVILPNKEETSKLANGIIEVLNDKVKDMYNMENLRIVDAAKVPVSPCNKNPVKFAVMGGAVGFVLSYIIILILHMFDDSIKDESDIEDKVGLQVLSTFTKQSHPESLSWNPKSDYAEGFKVLRTNLQFSKNINDKQTIAVCSIFPGEGKSWVTTNLAMAFAKADYKVLVVDAELRKGVQHNKFHVDQKPGLIDIIKNTSDIENFDSWRKFIKDTVVDNIKIITSGGNILDSSELLLSNKLRKIIDAVKKEFDIIIFDSTPSALVTDAIVLSRVVDTNIIITEYEKTKIRDLKKLKRGIENVGGHISGVVINKVNAGSNKKYYYYGNEQSLVSAKHSNKKKRMAKR